MSIVSCRAAREKEKKSPDFFGKYALKRKNFPESTEKFQHIYGFLVCSEGDRAALYGKLAAHRCNA